MRYNLPVGMVRHSLGFSRSDLCLSIDILGYLKKSGPYIFHPSKEEDSLGLVIIILFLNRRNLVTMGRSSRIGNFPFKSLCRIPSSFIVPIIIKIGLDSKAHYTYTLMARFMISKKMRVF